MLAGSNALQDASALGHVWGLRNPAQSPQEVGGWSWTLLQVDSCHGKMLMTVHQKELVLGLMKGPVDHWPIGLWIYKEAGSSRSPWRGWNLLDLVTDVQECCQLRVFDPHQSRM